MRLRFSRGVNRGGSNELILVVDTLMGSAAGFFSGNGCSLDVTSVGAGSGDAVAAGTVTEVPLACGARGGFE
jgi:hypothetical protein